MLPKIPFRCESCAIYAFAKWRMDGEYVKFGDPRVKTACGNRFLRLRFRRAADLPHYADCYLAGIINAGGLFCDRAAKNIQFVSIGHKNIKDRRLRKKVPCGPGGVIADYVPFYFGPRSPMLFTINKGNVVGYTGGQAPIVHLVSSTEAVDAAGLDWVFYRRARRHGLYGLF